MGSSFFFFFPFINCESNMLLESPADNISNICYLYMLKVFLELHATECFETQEIKPNSACFQYRIQILENAFYC